MRGVISLLLGIVVFVGQARGQERPQGKVVADLWDAAYLQGGKAGYTHTSVRELERDGKKIFHSLVELHLTAKRFDSTVQLRMDTGTDETADGKVVGVFIRQYLGRDKQLTITGTVTGTELRLVQDGTQTLKSIPWDARVIGQYRQLTLFQDRHVKPGDAFSYYAFEPSINQVIRTAVRVKDYETIQIAGGQKHRLLRVESTPEKIKTVQLPTLLSWLDEEGTPLRSQVDIPGLGLLTLFRTTREGARAPGQVVQLTDIGIGNFVRLRQRIANPYGTERMVYRVTVKGDADPATTFARDARQQVKNVRGNSFDLIVHASRPPRAGEDEKAGPAPGDEFLESSYFITSGDAKVKELARKAVGDESDAWAKALRMEKWVHDHMHAINDEALATADHVARTLEGDCTEYAMLLAAMCRAAGIPSKTAVGLIYADTATGPVFAFHMWTEVWVRGRWIALDGTLGRGHVGATHLKITDASWQDTRSPTPLLPVLRVLGRVSIDVAGAGSP